MAAGLGFFGSKCGPEAVDLSEGGCRRFVVQLPALCQVSLLTEIIGLEQRGRPFGGIGCKNRCIDQNKSAVVEEISAGSNNFVPNTKNRVLPMRAKPEMPVLHKKARAMLLCLDRKLLRHELDRPEVPDIQFTPARRPGVCPYLSGHYQGRFLRQLEIGRASCRES